MAKKASSKKPSVKPAAKKTSVKSAAKKTSVKKIAAELLVKEASTKPVEKKILKNKDQNDNIDFLKNFDWHNYKEGIDVIENKQLESFEKLVKENFVDTSDDDVIEGEVIYMTEREAIIDINAKSEGVISLNEFRYNPNLKVGDKVEVIVDIREDKSGQLVLSHKKARIIKAWERINNVHASGEIVQGFVKCRTKGCLLYTSPSPRD